MRIECPSCTAAYDLPEQHLVAGRAVRCARCGASWTPVPTQPPGPGLAATPIVAPPRPPRVKVVAPSSPALAGSPADVRGHDERRLVLVGWVLSIAVLLLIGWAAVTWRDGIMRAWPPSERAYAAFGLVGPARP